MKIIDQVTSLEISKKLKKIGVKQESAFYWAFAHNCTEYPPKIYYIGNDNPNFIEEHWSAFTVAELAEILPKQIRGFDLLIRPMDGSTPLKWHLGYVENNQEGYEYRFERQASDNLANAMAWMLIYLIKDGLIFR